MASENGRDYGKADRTFQSGHEGKSPTFAWRYAWSSCTTLMSGTGSSLGDDVEKLSKPGRFDEPVLIIRANLEKEKVFGHEVLLFDPKGARQRAADIAQGKSEEKEMDEMRDRRATEGLKLR